MTVTASKYELKRNEKYETEPWATEACLRALKGLGLWSTGLSVWEPAAGNHKMVKPIYDAGAKKVITSDICQYDFNHTAIFDFLSNGEFDFVPDSFNIMTNPPYGSANRTAVKFIELALERCDGFIAFLLTAKFDFGVTRKHLFKNNNRFTAKLALLDRISFEDNGQGGTEDHAWYIWGPSDKSTQHSINMYDENINKIRKQST